MKKKITIFYFQEDANVICVDWTFGAINLYLQSSANTAVVAKQISKMIMAINQYFGIRSNANIRKAS